MLKLKLQYFGHLVQRTDSLEKTLMLGKIEGVRPDPRGYDGPPLLSLPLAERKSLTVGASQILGTNDSTLHQLKSPHPSQVEGPVSPRRLGLVTYLNPCPSSLAILCNECIKTTPNTVWAQTSSTCLVQVQNPSRKRFTIKKPVRHSFGVLVVFT